MNILTISTGRDAGRHCKVVWILARQHPVETTGSYMVEGMIKHLCQLLHLQPEGSFYDRYIFKIVPMVNADGVIYGNARAEITGIDPNRVWKKTSKTLTPVISCLRKCILKAKEEVSLVLDLHSHSKQTGCFFYGNHLNNDPKACKLLPSLFCRDDPRFNFKNCRFRGGHEATARRVLFEELKQVNVYTVECSLLGYQKNNRIV